ncbi:MAG: SpoIIE family protein phosphatase [Anaerolineae bacterium]|nr:SpoIIE family protein phosphatase [Anaerolineae bacterium]
MVDGRSSSHEAKQIAGRIARQVISLIADGVRDGAAARAASDQLFTDRDGNAAADLSILSPDLQTGTIVISRNSPTPIFVAQGDRIECIDNESPSIGTSRNIKPSITEISLLPGSTVVMYTDGVLNAGRSIGIGLDICTLLEALLDEQEPTAQEIADTLLQEALRLENSTPQDDMSIVVLHLSHHMNDHVRRMTIRLPVEISDYSD